MPCSVPTRMAPGAGSGGEPGRPGGISSRGIEGRKPPVLARGDEEAGAGDRVARQGGAETAEDPGPGEAQGGYGAVVTEVGIPFERLALEERLLVAHAG